ncbi:hypothetical protein JTB14_006945 [Gonioctena quinquepunctata]|nr:hypothetical protein JTB14_006945 [Gonioctena quinquepunctata]
MFQRTLIKKWPEDNRHLPIEKVTFEADNQTDIKPTVSGAGTQTCPWNLGSDPIDRIINTTEYEAFKQMAEVQWRGCAVKNSKIVVGYPLNTDDATVMVVLVGMDDKKLYRQRYPVLANLHGDLEIIEQTIKIRGQLAQCNRKIIKVMLDGTQQDTWKRLFELKKETVQDTQICIHHILTTPLVMFRKMTEGIFHGSLTAIDIYTTASPTLPQPTLEHHMVSSTGISYKDILGKVTNILGNNEEAKR